MKIVYLLLISLFLNANCSQTEAKKANELFYEATQTKALTQQVKLLESSLKLCFTYEAELTLLTLQAEQVQDKEEKLKLYDKALESLSQIKNNDALVRAEQSRINKIIGKMYEKEQPLLSDIYRNKAEAQKEIQKKEEKNYLPWIVSLLLLVLWATWDLLKKWGNF